MSIMSTIAHRLQVGQLTGMKPAAGSCDTRSAVLAGGMWWGGEAWQSYSPCYPEVIFFSAKCGGMLKQSSFNP